MSRAKPETIAQLRAIMAHSGPMPSSVIARKANVNRDQVRLTMNNAIKMGWVVSHRNGGVEASYTITSSGIATVNKDGSPPAPKRKKRVPAVSSVFDLGEAILQAKGGGHE